MAANEGTNVETLRVNESLNASAQVYIFCKERLRGLDSADSVQVTRDELVELKKFAEVVNKSIVGIEKESRRCVIELCLVRQAVKEDAEAGDAGRGAAEGEAPVDAKKALKAAVTTYRKEKPFELHFAALIKATRSRAVRCDPLTADSDPPALERGCEALAAALGTVRGLTPKQKESRGILQGLLAYPSPQLLVAFATALGPQGGGQVEMAVEAELAARRAVIVSDLIQPAAAPAHVKQKDLFRRIREDFPDAWVASCGALLAKANAALDTLTADGRATVKDPPRVVGKWEVALSAAHGDGCKFKSESQGTHKKIHGAHIYRFELS